MSEQTPKRLAYIDNLRSTMIFLVVAMHAAVTYSHMGSWYYTAPEPLDRPSTLVFGILQAHLQAFFMGLLFLLAGYFTPTAYDRKGLGQFLKDRFVRLGLPALLFVFVVHDTMGHFLLHWHHEGFWSSYRYYLVHGDFVDGTGPMWFAVALLGFSLVYALSRAIVRGMEWKTTMPNIAAMLAMGAVIAALTFFVRTAHPVGTSFHNFQLCFFPQYIVLFAVGIFAKRGDWFARFPTRTGYRLLIGAAILGPTTWCLVVGFGGVLAGNMAGYNGGWSWVSAGIAAWEQIFAVAICAGLVVLYREKFNTGGRFSKLMSANSFGIYVFHAPVLVSVTLLMAPFAAPPLLKAAMASVLAFAATLAFVHFVARRIPGLKRIL